MFAACAPARPSRSLANYPEGTIYLKGNLGEAAGARKATDLRNQKQIRSCHLGTASEKAVPHEFVFFHATQLFIQCPSWASPVVPYEADFF